MTHHCARLIVVAIATVSFSTPITAQQEPTSPQTLEALVETLGGRVSQNEQGEIVGVRLSGPEVTDAGLAHLAGLTALETLFLGVTQVTDAGLAHLAGLTALKDLVISANQWDPIGTQVTDAGLAHLTGLTALEALWLESTEITDVGLAHLAKLTELESLTLTGTQVTDAGVAELQKALPNCGIVLQAPILDPIYLPPFPPQ